jgi:SAM-dependent methyltransferase
MRSFYCLLLLSAIALAQTTLPQVRINAPYVQTPREVILAMLKIANVKQTDVVYDLGCGDGRILIAAAQVCGARGVGVDIHADRVAEAQRNALKASLAGRLLFREQDLFETDLSPATVVTLYLLPQVNLELRPKLLRELKPGTRIVSHAFDLGDWKPDRQLVVAGTRVFLWIVPPRQSQ